MKAGWFRHAILMVHLYAGLFAALVLIVVGLSGTALAFRDDYFRWQHASFWKVEPGAKPLSESELVANVEAAYAPGKVSSIRMFGPDSAHFFFTNNEAMIWVNRYDGKILDAGIGKSFANTLVIKSFDLHTQLAAGPIGRLAVDIATYFAVILVPTGFVLWWRVKRKSVKWSASWNRLVWDLHNCAGAFAGIPILFLAVTGSLIALRIPDSVFEASNPQLTLQPPISKRPAGASTMERLNIDTVLAEAVFRSKTGAVMAISRGVLPAPRSLLLPKMKSASVRNPPDIASRYFPSIVTSATIWGA